MDLFGDGSVVVKRWVGHTPGSQMLMMRLPKTGTIILTSDNVYLRENVEKNIPPNVTLAYDPAGILRAYEWIRYMQATEKADFFTAHDPDAFKALKKPRSFMSKDETILSPLPATASAEGAQLNGRPFPATASAEGRLIKGGPSLWERVRVRGFESMCQPWRTPGPSPPPSPAGRGSQTSQEDPYICCPFLLPTG